MSRPYGDMIDILDVELRRVLRNVEDVTDEQRTGMSPCGSDWTLPTKLQPPDPALPPWTVFGVLRQAFSKTIEECRATPPDTVGSGYHALMRLDEFATSRIVEAVVHGMDLTDALGREPDAGPEAVAVTAGILDELLARRTVAGRPADLIDDRAWIRVASGRGPHPDPRLPLIG
jgi:hypothetical protein